MIVYLIKHKWSVVNPEDDICVERSDGALCLIRVEKGVLGNCGRVKGESGYMIEE